MTAALNTFGCCIERAFNLSWVHVLTADEDHVGSPVAEEHVTVGVDRAHVAEALPVVGQRARLEPRYR